MMIKVTKESVRAVCDIVKDIEKAINNLDFDSREEYNQTVTYLESCLRHIITDLKEYPPLDI
jgi:hypothetical protein